MEIILASKSPRRLELLKMLGAKDIKVIPSEGEENVKKGLMPGDTVAMIAYGKGKEVADKCDKNALVVAADTLVYLGGDPLGKPKDEEDAKRMLRALSGKSHTVYTGVALFCGGMHMTGYEQTEVYFRDMSEKEIDQYVKSGEPMDKAGAYGAQGLGAVFIRAIEGDFFNVMGLPLCKLSVMLRTPGFLPEDKRGLSLFGL